MRIGAKAGKHLSDMNRSSLKIRKKGMSHLKNIDGLYVDVDRIIQEIHSLT